MGKGAREPRERHSMSLPVEITEGVVVGGGLSQEEWAETIPSCLLGVEKEREKGPHQHVHVPFSTISTSPVKQHNPKSHLHKSIATITGQYQRGSHEQVGFPNHGFPLGRVGVKWENEQGFNMAFFPLRPCYLTRVTLNEACRCI